MKIKNIVFFIVFVLSIILLPSMIFFMSNSTFWNNFIFSNNINKSLESIFSENDLLKLKKADYYYKLWEYDKAFKKYLEIDCNNKDTCFILNHNIWNTAYKLWENLNNLDKLNLWQKSLSYYSKALNIKYDKKTKKNYDFVLNKLNDLIKEIKKQDESKNNKENSNEEEKQKEQNNEKEQKQDKWSSDSNWWKEESVIPKMPSIQINNDKKKALEPLSEEEKTKLENYMKWLQEEEKQNIEFNKPQDDRDITKILEEDFFSTFDKNENDW